MTHKIITTENYLLVVDDSEIKYKTWYLDDANQVRQCVVLDTDYWKSRKNYKKIIAHLPINSPILEGVDLLPPLKDEVEKLAQQEFDRPYIVDMGTDITPAYQQGFVVGYNKAKEKYKYTEDDLRNAIQMAWEADSIDGVVDLNIVLHYGNNNDLRTKWSEDEIVQSLQQPKMPVGFLEKGSYNGTWIGEYIY